MAECTFIVLQFFRLTTETIDALIIAIRDFAGGVLVVSHDQHFIESCTNELWVVNRGEVKQFRGQFKDYKKAVMKGSA